MDSIRQYLLCVICAALLCGIVTGIAGKKGAIGAVVKLLSGLFLAVAVISPWVNLDALDFSSYTEGLSADAEQAVSYGSAMASEATSAIIKEQAEAYILDKATSLGAEISVCVTVSDADIPMPHTVSIKGAVSPYIKGILEQYIAENLAIPEENQTWT